MKSVFPPRYLVQWWGIVYIERGEEGNGRGSFSITVTFNITIFTYNVTKYFVMAQLQLVPHPHD
jgi:hypothetical protein